MVAAFGAGAECLTRMSHGPGFCPAHVPPDEVNDVTICLLAFLLWPTDPGQDSTHSEVQAVPSIDINRYLGTWYEIARFPNRFQESCAGEVSATYSLYDDGDIRVLNRCMKDNGEMTEAEGRARRASVDGPNSKLKVRFAPAFLAFLPFVWGDYWVIDIAPDYSYAVVGEPRREYLWILSRTPVLDEQVLGGIIARIREQGYDVSRLVRTRQTH